MKTTILKFNRIDGARGLVFRWNYITKKKSIKTKINNVKFKHVDHKPFEGFLIIPIPKPSIVNDSLSKFTVIVLKSGFWV